MPDANQHQELLRLASNIVAAFVSKNECLAGDIPTLLTDTYEALAGASDGSYAPSREPAVPVDKSVTKDFIVCLEDGKKLKMLKRYLSRKYGLSPDEYRRKWGLPHDYPMTAPNYSKTRSKLAKDSGLGTHPIPKRKTRKPRKAA